VNEDGQEDWILQEGDRLVWLAGPHFRERFLIDTGAGMSDCIGTKLLGHRGVLVAHRGLQVRFYEPLGKGEEERWPYREIYSFYTASFQGGLALRDVDKDGRVDIYCGNYWIRSPESFDLPWRLFAIETYNDLPESAHLALEPLQIGGKECLVVSQGELREGAKMASFCTGGSVVELWEEQRMEGELGLVEPAALAVGDLNGDELDDFVVGERAGKGRIWVWLQRRGGRFERRQVSAGNPVHTLMLVDENADGYLDVVGIGKAQGWSYRNPRLQ
jgi:hypothetical protein